MSGDFYSTQSDSYFKGMKHVADRLTATVLTLFLCKNNVVWPIDSMCRPKSTIVSQFSRIV